MRSSPGSLAAQRPLPRSRFAPAVPRAICDLPGLSIRTRKTVPVAQMELAVLERLADCKSERATAKELGVSVRSVEHHRTQLMRKLKTNSVVDLLRFALTMKQ